MANTITDGSAASSGSVPTLATLVSKWRNFLDDANTPYLWSNQELTDYANRAINDMCREIPLIEDSTTVSICRISVVEDTATYSVSDRIVFVKRAKLAGDTSPLQKVTLEWMDANFSDWEDADSDDVQYIITEGVGTNKIRLHPPPDTTEYMWLTVTRLPTADLVYSTDSGASPEIGGKYLDMLDNGVYYYAYLKQDSDTYDQKKADYHYKMWQRDMEYTKRSMLKYRSVDRIAAPMKAFM